MLSVQPSGYPGADWDATLQRLGGDLLQSWRWGEFKQRHGWDAERIQVAGPNGDGMAQVLFRQCGWFALAYVPRGPVIAERDTAAPELLEAIDETCARHRTIVLIIEPDHPLPLAWTGEGSAFVRGPEPFQACRTVKVPLAPDADLLAQMRKDTRYNILHAQRRGTTVERGSVEPWAIQTFYRLMQETSQRNGFGIHACSYYEDFLRIFEDQAILLFSRVDSSVTAGLIAARCGNEARSMYAGSASSHRSRGHTTLLRFEAMRWAREQGCTLYDLGGIAPAPPTVGGRGSDLDGVEQFKVGFGGEIIAYPPTVEHRYEPGLAWLLRRFSSRFRTAPGSSE